MAHVVAAEDGGPRANPQMTPVERGSYDNLILLCPTCHTIVDKAPSSFPESKLREWKDNHTKRIAELFGEVPYATRSEARKRVEPLLAENKLVFESCGPETDGRFDPEGEQPRRWVMKLLSTIIPNNRRILRILDMNRALLTSRECVTVTRFRQHVTDLEARHVAGDDTGGTETFPAELSSVFLDAP
jgi:hypothetical protein